MTAELATLAAAGLPEWGALAVTLLGIAWRVAHNARASARAQGERIGALEQRSRSTELRRYQVEAALLRAGVALPAWPDGPHPRDLDPPAFDEDADDDFTAALPTQHFTRHHLDRPHLDRPHLDRRPTP